MQGAGVKADTCLRASNRLVTNWRMFPENGDFTNACCRPAGTTFPLYDTNCSRTSTLKGASNLHYPRHARPVMRHCRSYSANPARAMVPQHNEKQHIPNSGNRSFSNPALIGPTETDPVPTPRSNLESRPDFCSAVRTESESGLRSGVGETEHVSYGDRMCFLRSCILVIVVHLREFLKLFWTVAI
jgi:hypothetical protein